MVKRAKGKKALLRILGLRLVLACLAVVFLLISHPSFSAESSVNRQIFTGQEHDENTGLIYFGARYYDPDAARFITQDTYLGEYGTPASLHRYLYAYSNPTVNIDKDGHAVCGGLCIGGVIVGTVSLYDYLFSDRREITAKKLGAETFTGRVASDTVALAGSVANTVTFGYSDAIQEGGKGALEHTIQLSGYRSYEAAYKEVTSDDPDYILSTLYGVKGLGETASLALIPAGVKTTVKTPGAKTFTNEEAVLTTESRSGMADFTSRHIKDKSTTNVTVASSRKVYNESRFGSEVGTVGRNVKVTQKSVPEITFKPKWSGQVQRYRKGDMTAIEHITSRHGYNSGYSNVSKFSEGTSVKNIKSMVDEAAARGTFTQTRTGSAITHDFGRTIGTNQAGQSTSRIAIHLDSSGSVRTAYPY